ncbi:MAG: outer membrane beta-barrel protein [Prevotella sp.]|nr:outer membrane beta-barrel protein [Prevotella sp.]
MRRYFLILLLCAIVCGAVAQRITRRYDNVSMAQALRELNSLQGRYTVNFIYDELEDFRVTTTIRNESVPDAVRQLIGFYPIRMTRRGSVLLVECTHKTRRHLTGTVVDETGQPVPYANVLLLSVIDSSVVAGGVSNESGVFVIPYEPAKVIARVSYIGYKPVYRTFSTENAGTIHLTPDALQLKAITVKTVRPQYKMTRGGMTIDIENSLLAKMGTAIDVLGQLPRVSASSSGVQVFAKGQPLVYINNRKISDMKELAELKSDNIKIVEVITSPGAEYDAQVQSVIRIRTLRRQADGLSFRNDASVAYNTMWSGSESVRLTYRTRHWELFNNLYWTSDVYRENNDLDNRISANGDEVDIRQHIDDQMRRNVLSERIGASFLVNDSNSLGGSYWGYADLPSMGTLTGHQNISKNGVPEGVVGQDGMIEKRVVSRQQADLYYAGKVGKLGIDFNGSYMFMKYKEGNEQTEWSDQLGSRQVHSYGMQRSHLWAGKLVLSHPVGRGSLNLGTEFTYTDSWGNFSNREQYVSSSETDIRERNQAVFSDYTLPLGHFSLSVGLRYEHVVSDYYSFGMRQDDASRRYSNFFPSVSLSWNKGRWAFQLSYSDRIDRPSYRSLRNFIQYNNRYTYEGGNPAMRPAQIHNVEASGIYGWLSMSAGYKYIRNTMEWTPGLYQDQTVIYLTNYNFDHLQQLYASVTASPKLGWYQPMAEVGYLQQIFHAPGDNVSSQRGKPTFRLNLNNRLSLSKSFMATLGFRWRTAVYSGFQKIKGRTAMSLSLRKSFSNDRLVLHLNMSDLLNSDRERWTLSGYGVVIDKDCNNYARAVSLTVTYNFNARRSKYKGTGAGNAEKSRL